MPTTYYIETSIPSFYYDTRSDIQAQAMRQWTRTWWDAPDKNATRFVSVPVLVELQRTASPKKENALQLIKDLWLLDYDTRIDEIIAVNTPINLCRAMPWAMRLILRWHHSISVIFW